MTPQVRWWLLAALFVAIVVCLVGNGQVMLAVTDVRRQPLLYGLAATFLVVAYAPLRKQ